MKANEAPKKLYLFSNGLISYCRNTDEDVEYTRTDALIEKACKFLNKELPITDLSPSNMFDITFKVFDKENKKVFIENFKNYIKGE
jgi:hypothetical protein